LEPQFEWLLREWGGIPTWVLIVGFSAVAGFMFFLVRRRRRQPPPSSSSFGSNVGDFLAALPSFFAPSELRYLLQKAIVDPMKAYQEGSIDNPVWTQNHHALLKKFELYTLHQLSLERKGSRRAELMQLLDDIRDLIDESEKLLKGAA